MKTLFSCAALLAAALAATQAWPQGRSDPPPRPFETLAETMRARSTYIFQLDPGIPAARVPAHAAALTRAVGGELRHTYTETLHGFAATMPSVALIRLLEMTDDIVAYQRDSVDFAYRSHRQCPGHPSCKDGGTDPELPPTTNFTCTGDDAYQLDGYTDFAPWGIARIGANAPTVHGAGKCGADVHVYVIDTGIDLDHPDLAPLGASVDCTRGPNCRKGGDGNDDHGHGTHVAGTIAARIDNKGLVGVAPAAELHAVKVLNANGLGFRSDIIAGIEWIMTQVDGAPVIANMSLGGTGGKTGTCTASGYSGPFDSYHQAICNAANAGVVFVVAAGNEGADAAGHVPAAYDDAVVTISATTANSWPDWSNFGDELPVWAGVATPPQSAPVGIAAPGVEIESTRIGGIGTLFASGTSMATPHVAGAVALSLEGASLPAEPFDVFEGIRAKLLDSAEPTGGFGGNTTARPHAEGFLDVEKLLNPGTT